MGGMEGADKNEKDKRTSRLGAVLGAALAAGAPGAAKADFVDFDNPPSNYGSFELFEPREEALNVFKSLNEELDGKLSITAEQIARLRANIDKFIQENPAIEGSTEQTAEGASSTMAYDPVSELKSTLEKIQANPLVWGFSIHHMLKMFKGPGMREGKQN